MSGLPCSFEQFRGREIVEYMEQPEQERKSIFMGFFGGECLRHCIVEASMSFINFVDCLYHIRKELFCNPLFWLFAWPPLYISSIMPGK